MAERPKETSDRTDDDVQEAFWQLENEPRENPPELLYHYTSPESMMAIMGERALHATHVRFMADAAEIYYGRDLLRSVVQEKLATWDAGEAAILEDALLMFAQARDFDLPPIFALCFSERHDDAAQWDRYASAGRGFAIGFRGNQLGINFRKRDGQGWMDSGQLVRVLYDEAEQRRLFGQIVDKAKRFAEPARDSGTQKDFQSKCSTIGHAAGWAIMRLMARCKGVAYESEREWRLIYTKGPSVIQSLSNVAEVKVTGLGLSPYVALEYCRDFNEAGTHPDPLPVTEVVHGPRTRPEAPDATRVVLNKAGYLHVIAAPASEHPDFIQKRWNEAPVWLRPSSVRLV